MKDIDICYGYDAAHWGLTDLYEESKQKLKDALASGEDFDTGWWGCKKEIRYARICRENGKITVQVSCHMDDLWEEDSLIYDALWEERHTEEELPEEIIESIRSEAIEVGIDEETTETKTIHGDALLCNVTDLIEKLEDEAESKNTEMYNRLRTIVAEHYDYWKELKNQ